MDASPSRLPLALDPSNRQTQDWRAWLPNLVCFQAGWLSAVLGAAHGLPWLGPLVIGLCLSLHLLRAPKAWAEARLLIAATAVGLLFEFVPFALGWLDYPAHGGLFVPWWMISLWPNFASTLNVSLRSLRHRFGLLALLGGIGGPAAYWSGASLGAMQWIQPLPALIYLALGWALLTPLLARLAMHLDGYRHGH
jgi:hypothetical protein